MPQPSQGSFGPLNTPFKRLGALPETMNWVGNWSSSDTYYKNDVAFDVTANNSYILINTSKTGGSRPELNTGDWAALAPGSGGSGVTSVTGTANQIGVTAGLAPVVSLAAPSPAPTPGAYTNANITIDGLGRVTTAANGSAGTANPGLVSASLVSNTVLSFSATNNILVIPFTSVGMNARVAVFYSFTFVNTNATASYSVALSTNTPAGNAVPSLSIDPYLHIPANLASSGLTQTTVTYSGTLLFTCPTPAAQQIRFLLTPTTDPAGALVVAGINGVYNSSIVQAYGPVTP